jgi:trk system potassium uptake protein TrkA
MRMKERYAVIGLGEFGCWVAKTLAGLGCDVWAVDYSEERVRNVSGFVAQAVIVDPLDEKALRSANVQNVDVAVVSIDDNIEANILAVMAVKQLGVNYIVAIAATRLHFKVLERLRVDRIVCPERDSAIQEAHRLIGLPIVNDKVELSPGYSIIKLPTSPALSGRSLAKSGLSSKLGPNVIAVRRGDTEKEEWNINPLPTEIIHKGELLVIIGRNIDLDHLSHLDQP